MEPPPVGSVRIQFAVRASVEAGESIYLLGSSRETGAWEADQAQPLHTDESSYPVWRTRLYLPRHAPPLEYKYLIKVPIFHEHHINNRMSIIGWETRKGQNRILTAEHIENVLAASINSPPDEVVVYVDDGEYGDINDDSQTIQKISYADSGFLNKEAELRIRVGYHVQKSVKLLDPVPYKLKISTIPYDFQNPSAAVAPIPLNLTLLRCQTDRTFRIRGIKQPEDGWEWDDAPNQITHNIYWMRTLKELKNSNYALLIEVFTAPNGETPPSPSRRLGVATVVPRQMQAFSQSCGVIPCPLINVETLRPIGQFYLNYLTVHPFDHPLNKLDKVWGTYWDAGRALDIGHRGSGAHGTFAYTVQENTIRSFIKASESGADFVEFDVQLSKDKIPIIYHNFKVSVTVKRSHKKEGEENAKDTDFHDLFINELTLEQIRALQLDFVDRPEQSHLFRKLTSITVEKNAKFKKLVRKVIIMNQLRKDKKPREEREEKARMGVPTLEEVLLNVPESVGFNIEVKFPVPEELKDPAADQSKNEWEDRNDYADRILKVVFDHANNRRIVFSSFDPDICTILRKKQPKFPVLFLTGAGMYDPSQDVRCNSIQQAALFAKSEKFLGIVSHSTPLMKDLSLIPFVKQQGLILFTYGAMNNVKKNVALQKQLGVDGVITDDLKYVKAEREVKSQVTTTPSSESPQVTKESESKSGEEKKETA